MEQFNGVTSFIDGSTIYGSNKESALSLRGGEENRANGKLFTSKELPNFLPTRKECGGLLDNTCLYSRRQSISRELRSFTLFSSFLKPNLYRQLSSTSMIAVLL